MKLTVVFFLALVGVDAGCLTIDSLTPSQAPCASGTCKTEAGVIGPAEWKAMTLPQFKVVGHNSCKAKQPARAGFIYIIEVAFYDKEDYRIGIGTLYVASLGPGEKFKHDYEIPGDVRVNGPVVAIRVRSITETVAIPGKP